MLNRAAARVSSLGAGHEARGGHLHLGGRPGVPGPVENWQAGRHRPGASETGDQALFCFVFFVGERGADAQKGGA